MSNQTFVILCLVGVFGLIAVVGGFMTLWLFHDAKIKAWTKISAIAKATGATPPKRPKPVGLIIFCVVAVIAVVALAAIPLATVSVSVKLPGRKPVTYGAPLPVPKTPATPPAVTPAPASPPATNPAAQIPSVPEKTPSARQ